MIDQGAALGPWLQDCNPIITGLRHLTDYRNSYLAPFLSIGPSF